MDRESREGQDRFPGERDCFPDSCRMGDEFLAEWRQRDHDRQARSSASGKGGIQFGMELGGGSAQRVMNSEFIITLPGKMLGW